MYGRVYAIAVEIAALAAAKDLIRITAGATRAIRILSVEGGASDSEAAGQVGHSIYYATTAGTGTAFTPRPLSPGDAAFTGSAVVNLTADTTKSPAEPVWTRGCDVRAGFEKVFPPGTEPEQPGAGIIVVRLEEPPPAPVDMRYTVIFMELG